MFEANIDYFKSKPVNIPKIAVMEDHSFNPEYLTKELEKIYSQIITKIRFKVAPKMSKHEKKSQGISGFVVIPYSYALDFGKKQGLGREVLRTLTELW